MITQFKFDDIRLFIKIRRGVKTLRNVKNVKKWIMCFEKDAFALIFTFDVIIYNVFIRYY